MLPCLRLLGLCLHEDPIAPAGQHQASKCSQEGEGSGDAQSRGEPVAEGLGRAEATDPGEHRCQDRDPERPAKLAQRAERVGRLADVARCHRADDGILGGGYGHRDATASDDQRRDELRVGTAGRGDQPNPGHPDGLQAISEI